jgi:glucose dehydrogenase
LPLYQVIPATRADELTPANGFPKRETFLAWHRSHGDNGGMHLGQNLFANCLLAIDTRTSRRLWHFQEIRPRRQPSGPFTVTRVIQSFTITKVNPANKPPWGTLNCIDLNTGKLLWKVPLGEYPALTHRG